MRRLIEEAFPLKKVSEDSKHEKSAGRKGHISTLHIWPARRPLAASRAVVIATLLPDPEDASPELRRAYEELAGTSNPVEQREDLCRRIEKVTRWANVDETELDRLRQLIQKAHGAGTPKVLDVFAGGGAIPLEAMRLGAHAIAVEYNPVAWFILKCTLEFPSRLAGKTWPLGELRNTASGTQLVAAGLEKKEGDLAAQVRHWGKWIHGRVEKDLAPYFLKAEGKNPVAYFWARTVPCQDPQCGADVPLIKTLWLCTRKGKERALRLVPNEDRRRIEFEVFTPRTKGEVGAGTVSNAKAFCSFHPTPLVIPSQYIKDCGKKGRMGARLTAVAVSGRDGKEYRSPSKEEISIVEQAKADYFSVMRSLPGGPLHEPLSDVAFRPKVGGVADLPRFGISHYGLVFIERQQLALGVITKLIRTLYDEVISTIGDPELAEAVSAYMYCVLARSADRNSSICTWNTSGEFVRNTFTRYALPMTWDFCEIPATSTATGGLEQAIELVASVVEHLLGAVKGCNVDVMCRSATALPEDLEVDAVITDPPYYAAFPYADLSDFFYVWLRRFGSDRYREQLSGEQAPRTDELIQHAGYTGGDHKKAKRRYEEGMAVAFAGAVKVLRPDGAMVVVFANKEPDAWDALVTSLIRAGWIVTGSWPIDTERTAKMGAGKAAHLSTSVWLVCRRRPDAAGVGRYIEVQKKMQDRIAERLLYFWNLGVSGPDFVWAAVGPALEAYSRFREVRRIDGSVFTVKEFLREVRRLVTDFALRQILHGASTEGLDEWTRYYLMHRSSFGLEPAPAGECILLSQGYNLDLNELRGGRGLLGKGKRTRSADEDAVSGDEESSGSGSDLRLLGWDERKRDDLGRPHPSGGMPLVDSLHRMIHLWCAGDTSKLRDYANELGLLQNELFWTVGQAVLEMSDPKSRERALLESIVAWGRGKESRHIAVQGPLFTEGNTL